jgi:CRP/FNR family transcriptional regulator
MKTVKKADFLKTIPAFKGAPAGREVTLYTVGKGDVCILNAACILSNTGYPANATVTEDSEALAVPSAHFRKLVNQYPEMRSYVFSLLGARLFEVIELLEDVLFRKMNERLEEYLRARAGKGSARITHQNIANDLGTSREVASRLLKDLERNGTVILERNRIRFAG